MKKPKLLTATFEESLNLENNVTKMMSDNIETTRPKFIFIMTIVVIIINYGIAWFTKSMTERQFERSPIPKAEINFYPGWLFYTFLIFFVLFWIYSHIIVKRYAANRFFWGHLNGNNLVIWIFFEVSFLILTGVYYFYPVWIWIIILSLLILVISLMIKNQIYTLKTAMFNTGEKKHLIKQGKIIQKIIQFGGIIMSIYLIIKFIFPEISKTTGNLLSVFLLTFVVPGFLLLMAVIEIYVELPFILQNYYKIKYAEEYRKLEGKTQIEWYGYNYYKKYINSSPNTINETDLSAHANNSVSAEDETMKTGNKISKLLLINIIIGILLCIPVLAFKINYLMILDIFVLINSVTILRKSKTNTNLKFKTSSILMIVASIINIIGFISLIVYATISRSDLITEVSSEAIAISKFLFYTLGLVSWTFRISATIFAFIERQKISKLLKNKDKEDENE